MWIEKLGGLAACAALAGSRSDKRPRRVLAIGNRGAHGTVGKRPLPARPAGEGDSVARHRSRRKADPCHLVWQVNQILRLTSVSIGRNFTMTASESDSPAGRAGRGLVDLVASNLATESCSPAMQDGRGPHRPCRAPGNRACQCKGLHLGHRQTRETARRSLLSLRDPTAFVQSNGAGRSGHPLSASAARHADVHPRTTWQRFHLETAQ